MRRFRLADHNERPIAEGFQHSDGRVVVLANIIANEITMSANVYRTVDKMRADWVTASLEWLDGAEEVAANSDALTVVT